MFHAYNLSYLGDRDWGGSWFEASQGKKVSKTPSQKNPPKHKPVWWYIPVIQVLRRFK
jgi:hypothetical protein